MTTATASTFYTFDPRTLPDPASFPDADVVVLDHRVETTLHPDGRVDTVVRRAWLYTSVFGRDKFGDVPVQYRPGLQDVEVLNAVSWLRDGTEKKTPDYGFNEIVPFPLDRAPDLGDVRQLVVSLVGTEVGGPSVLEYAIRDKRPWREFFWGEETLGEEFPVLRKQIVLRVPAGKTLEHGVANLPIEPEVGEDDEGFRRFTWTAETLPAFDPEDRGAGADRYVPVVRYSAAGTWEEVSERFRRRVEKGVALDGTLRETASEKTKDCSGPVAEVVALQGFVLKGVRTLDFHADFIDYAFRGAARVLESGYGTALEKGVLLCALAGAAGLRARLFLAVPEWKLFEDVHAPGPGAETWVQLQAGRMPLWCRPDKPLHQAGKWSLEGMRLVGLDESRPDLERAKTRRPSSLAAIEANLELQKDLTLKGNATLRLEGGFNPFWKVAADEKTTVEKLAGEFASKILGGAKPASVRAEILSPSRTVFSFALEGGKAERVGDGFASLAWPDVPAALHGYVPAFHREARCTPLMLAGSADATLEMKIVLPRDARVRILPPGVKRRGPAARVDLQCKEKDGRLEIRGTWRFPKTDVLPEEYEAFRRAVSASASAENRSVLLQA